MRALKQIALLLSMVIVGAPARLRAYLITVIAVACVVGVLVAMLSMGSGLRTLAATDTRSDRVVVESNGAPSTLISNIERSAVASIVDMPGIRRDGAGRPLATATSIVLAGVRSKADGSVTSIPLFGVDPEFLKVFPEVRLVAGRMFEPGRLQLIVAKSRNSEFQGLEIGGHIRLRGVTWNIVGTFDARGVAWNGLIGDQSVVQTAYQHDTVQMVSAVLGGPGGFTTLSAALSADPSMDLVLKHESEVREAEARGFSALLDFVSYFVGAVMALGATLGAVNVMYAIVDGRRRETATLRALGFRSSCIAIAIVIESLIVALPGAVVGVLAAWLLFNGNAVRSAGFSFHLETTWQLAALGVGWALVIGLMGGLTPAIRGARISVTGAFRAA